MTFEDVDDFARESRRNVGKGMSHSIGSRMINDKGEWG